MDWLFGGEIPLPLKFFVAFVIVLGLIGGAAYLVRRFGASALTTAAVRGRQPRLAVIDATVIDSRRRLVLVRRDNVEHLVLIGGPTDLVVEPNIIRAIPATPQREAQPARAASATDNLPRAVPLADPNSWAPEPPVARPQQRPAQAPAPAPADESLAWPLQPEPTQRAAAEPPTRNPEAERLAGLAADLSRVANEPAPRRAEARRAPPPVEERTADLGHMLDSALHPDLSEPAPPVAPPAAPAPALRPPPEPAPRAVDTPLRAKPIGDLAAPRGLEPRPARTVTGAKPAYDSLEQEMASLLGRPTGKS